MDAVESVMETPVDEFERYRSPMRVLARFFKKSRDQWKQKYMDVKRQIKRFKNQMYQLGKSKERWKQQALEGRKQIESLQAEVEQLRVRLTEPSPANGSKSQLLPTR